MTAPHTHTHLPHSLSPQWIKGGLGGAYPEMTDSQYSTGDLQNTHQLLKSVYIQNTSKSVYDARCHTNCF